MCGIAGLYNFRRDRDIDGRLLQRMNDVLSHRGPDGEGLYMNRFVGLAHRRLSIIDVAGGAQPMENETGDVVIVFNGEIYNYPELRAGLIKKGHVFKTNSDTEVIIHQYEEDGSDCVTSLRGMFAFAIWDKRRQALMLARDRIGIKPLYYTVNGGTLLFASEIKSIIEDQSVPREIDYESISDYFSLLFIPAPKTIYKGIYKLNPGHKLICGAGTLKIDKYWDLKCEKPSSMFSEDEYIGKTMEILQRTVKDHMVSEVPIGAFLSGGVDSSTIAALMQRSTDERVRTCSIGFSVGKFNEAESARRVADHLNTRHFEHFVTPDVTGIIDKLLWHLDEPFADASMIPTYYVCKIAREHVTVALSGDGGDELFAGYTNYRRGQIEDSIKMVPYAIRKAIITPVLAAMPPMMKSSTLLKNLLSNSQRSYFNKWCYFSEEMKSSLFSEGLKSRVGSLDSFNSIEPYYRQASAMDSLSQHQYMDLKTYLVDDILTKVDKMSMANSLEVRVPFLDHKVVEFAFTIPSELKLSGGATKYILKKMMESFLPMNILERKKHGFMAPVGHWLRNELKEYAEDILFDRKTMQRGYFNSANIEKVWKEHLMGKRWSIDISMHIWSLLVFELWHRRFVDKGAGQAPSLSGRRG